MFKRIKNFFESMAYAGLKPTTPGAPQEFEARTGAFGRFRDKVDRFLAGPATSDPLYLTNRTLWQKLRPALIIAVPCAILLGGLTLGLMNYFALSRQIAPPQAGPTSAEIAKQLLPLLNKDLGVVSQHDVDLLDVMIAPGSAQLTGIAKNLTDHNLRRVEMVFELTDKSGSRQGAVSKTLENIPAKSSMSFQLALEQRAAALALVRDVKVD